MLENPSGDPNPYQKAPEKLKVPEAPEVGEGLTLHEVPKAVYQKIEAYDAGPQDVLPKEEYIKNYNEWLQQISKKYPDVSLQAQFTTEFPGRQFHDKDKLAEKGRFVILKRPQSKPGNAPSTEGQPPASTAK